jgi:plastocyanin
MQQGGDMNRFWLVLAMFFAWPIHASELSVQVVDERGAAVADAVVYVELAAGAKRSGKPAAAVMDQRDKEFVPHVLVVQKGAEVAFPNGDNIHHHVYSFSGVQTFEFPLYKNGQRPRMRFGNVGAVPLGCNIHNWMMGYIYVVDTPWFTKTSRDGSAKIKGLNQSAAVVKVWHPRIKGGVIEQPYQAQNSKLKIQLKLKPDLRRPRPATYDSGIYSGT